jgi:hypothetical protein
VPIVGQDHDVHFHGFVALVETRPHQTADRGRRAGGGVSSFPPVGMRQVFSSSYWVGMAADFEDLAGFH